MRSLDQAAGFYRMGLWRRSTTLVCKRL